MPQGESRDGAQLGYLQPAGFPGLPAGWVSEWETFPGSDEKLHLFGMHHHAAEGGGKRALFIVHGMGEHGGRYLHVPHFLQSEVDSVYCIDLRGHGRSEGIRGHAERFDALVNDCALALKRFDRKLRDRYGHSEIHLLGHSLGGHIALRMLLLHPELPVVSATVSAPFLGIQAKVPVTKKMAAAALSRVWGSLQLNTELDVAHLSHDPAVGEAYLADRLVHGKMTPKFFRELIVAMGDTMSRDSGIKVPLQMVVPMQDAIVEAEKSLQFFRNLKHRDKRLKTYPGFFHEPLNETGKEQVFEDIRSWIESHRPGTAVS